MGNKLGCGGMKGLFGVDEDGEDLMRDSMLLEGDDVI